jgi:hypothetical protein
MPSIDLPFDELRRPEVTPAGSAAELAHAGLAWVILVLADLALQLLGFHRFYRLVEGWPVLGSVPEVSRGDRARQTLTAVDRARTYYFRHARCLQRAVAAVCFLRMRGVRGELVIGVRKIPFQAHAWMELDGEIVNDDPALLSKYQVITRC